MSFGCSPKMAARLDLKEYKNFNIIQDKYKTKEQRKTKSASFSYETVTQETFTIIANL